MTYVITQPCIDVKDKSCVDVCPVSCIYIEDDGVDRKLYIHPDECIGCGACEPECPEAPFFSKMLCPPNGLSSSILTGVGLPATTQPRTRCEQGSTNCNRGQPKL